MIDLSGHPKFVAENAKLTNKPAYLVDIEIARLSDAQDLEADWNAGATKTNIDITTNSGSVILSKTAETGITPESQTGGASTQVLWAAIGGTLNSGWQSWKNTYTCSLKRKITTIKGDFSENGTGGTGYCQVFSSKSGASISTKKSAAIAGGAGKVTLTFDFTAEAIEIDSATEYWLEFSAQASGVNTAWLHYNTTTTSYTNGILDITGSAPASDIGDTAFEINFARQVFVISPTVGTIKTQAIDMGEVPTVDGFLKIFDRVQTNTTIVYTGWASTTGAFAGEETTLNAGGAITDGYAITGAEIKRYYQIQGVLTSASDFCKTPILDLVDVVFPDFLTISDHGQLSAPALISKNGVSSIANEINDFKPSSIGQISITTELDVRLSNFLATGKPRNKTINVYAGFIASGWVKADYLLYFSGLISDWKITAGNKIVLTTRDPAKTWDVQVPPKFNDAFGNSTFDPKTWTGEHAVDIIEEILEVYVAERDSRIDSTSFSDAVTAVGAFALTRGPIGNDSIKAKDAIEELRAMTNCYIYTSNDGKITIKYFDPSAAADDSLTDDDFLSVPTWEANNKEFYNNVNVYYGWDGAGTEKTDFTAVYINTDSTSVADYEEVKLKEIKDQWIANDAAGDVEAGSYSQWIINRYKDPPELLGVVVDRKKIALFVGDIVSVTTTQAPSSDLTGITARKFQIIRRELNFQSDRIKLKLKYVGT